jgi:hypothetical protein
MAASIVQTISNSDFAGSGNGYATSSTLTTVAAGDAVFVAFTHDSSAGTPTLSCADGTAATYTLLDSQNDAGNTQKMVSFLAVNHPGGSGLTVTVSWATTNLPGRGITAAQITGVSTNTLGANEHKSQVQTAPGTGTDAVTSTNMTPVGSGNNLIVGYSFNSTASSALKPAVGTGFTDSGGGFWSVGGGTQARLESKLSAGTGAVAATFTTTGGSDHHITMGISLVESSTPTSDPVGAAPAYRIARNTSLRM